MSFEIDGRSRRAHYPRRLYRRSANFLFWKWGSLWLSTQPLAITLCAPGRGSCKGPCSWKSVCQTDSSDSEPATLILWAVLLASGNAWPAHLLSDPALCTDIHQRLPSWECAATSCSAFQNHRRRDAISSAFATQIARDSKNPRLKRPAACRLLRTDALGADLCDHRLQGCFGLKPVLGTERVPCPGKNLWKHNFLKISVVQRWNHWRKKPSKSYPQHARQLQHLLGLTRSKWHQNPKWSEINISTD